EWVLSWAIGLGELPAPASVAPAAASTLYDQIEQTASELRTQRWNVPGSKALDIAKQTLLELRSQDPIPALDVMCNLDLVNQGLAARLLGLIDTLAQVLAAEGRIPTAAVLWHLPAQTIADIAHLRVPKLAPSHRFGMGSWEPMLFELICAAGTPYRAVAVVAGRGAGLLRPIQRLQDMESFKPREIVAALNPLNNLSPLLWSAPGVVTLHGGRGAHVFEVAGALSVPSLCNVGVDPKTLCEGALAAVDGTNATLWLLA
ncbi:MAG: hypothetical protein FWG47_07860, partial [Propionibacteriaceae bacterium]|nr:hypothetical protein [Propionibacteriaceae bacterium]